MTQRSTPSEPNLVFWKVQAVGWSAYAFALMMPWIGEYLVSIMLPNKVVVAGTGLLVSSGLRELYRWTVRAGAGADLRLLAVLAVIASAFGGLVWDRAVASLVGASAALDLRQFGVLDGGMPRLGGALYHALVLFAWTTVYLAVHGWKSRSEAVATPLLKGTRVVAQDGKRSVLLDAGEIDWVEAAGDYVRVHAGERKLLLRSTMATFESRLAEHEYVRIHRSTIVNVERVRELVRQPNNEYVVQLRDGTMLKASRSYSGRLKRALGLSTR